MKRYIIMMISLATLASSPYLAAENGTVSFPDVKDWQLSVSTDVYTPGNLWDLINGAAESYLSYDFVDLHLGDYENTSGTVIHAEVYRHSTPVNAYGIYTAERSPEYKFVRIGAQGYLEEGVLNFLAGQFYVKLYSTDSGTEVQEALQKIGQKISRHLDQEDGLPELLKLFSSSGQLPYSDQYIRENFIGFDFLHSAFTVGYEGGYKLFVIQGKDADEILEMAKKYLAFTKQDIDPASETALTFKDPYNGDIPAILTGSYMAGIIDGSDNEDARTLLEELVEALAK
ncbi:MAG: hypothetical protein KAT31_07495 [Bacteroidales bacterium]|nr:hypothetical protein [Bacteroidales bacterium]